MDLIARHKQNQRADELARIVKLFQVHQKLDCREIVAQMLHQGKADAAKELVESSADLSLIPVIQWMLHKHAIVPH